MTKPTISWSISLGGLLSLAAIIATGLTTFLGVRYQSASNEAALKDLRAEVIAARAYSDTIRTTIEVRVRALELSQARTDERYDNIVSLLTRMDGRLERIERKEP